MPEMSMPLSHWRFFYAAQHFSLPRQFLQKDLNKSEIAHKTHTILQYLYKIDDASKLLKEVWFQSIKKHKTTDSSTNNRISKDCIRQCIY